MSDKLNAASHEAVTVAVPAQGGDSLDLRGQFTVTARGPDGALIREETFDNLVPTQGRNAMLDVFLGRGTAYAANYFGLITAGTPVVGDTYASHAYTEAGTTIIAARLAPTWAAASGGSKATSTGMVFTITNASGATITGACQVFGAAGTSAAGDTATASAILYSAGLFSSSITVPQNSTLTITYSSTL